jgi:hypothetical protein
MTKKTRNWLITLAILIFPFVLFFGFLIFMEEPVPPLAPLPNPNGYDDLLKASQMLAASGDSSDATNLNQLREWVPKSAGALALARAGLSNQCRVPVQYTESYTSNHLDDLAGLKRLARAFAAEGRLAEAENRTDDAIKAYLDTIHLGNESARGGVLIDALVFAAINRARRAGLGHDDFREQRQFWLQLFPNPDRDNFARRIFEAGNFVQIIMIELFPDRLERRRDVRVIHQPAELRVALARHDDFHLEAVAVQPPAFVRLSANAAANAPPQIETIFAIPFS